MNRLLTVAISLTLASSAAYAQTDRGAFGNDTQASSDSLPASAGATSTASGAAAVAHQGQRSHRRRTSGAPAANTMTNSMAAAPRR